MVFKKNKNKTSATPYWKTLLIRDFLLAHYLQSLSLTHIHTRSITQDINTMVRGRVGANRSQTMTRWHLSEDGELNPPGDLSLTLSVTSPTQCLNPWDAQLTFWEGTRMASHRPVSGLLLDEEVSVLRVVDQKWGGGYEKTGGGGQN